MPPSLGVWVPLCHHPWSPPQTATPRCLNPADGHRSLNRRGRKELDQPSPLPDEDAGSRGAQPDSHGNSSGPSLGHPNEPLSSGQGRQNGRDGPGLRPPLSRSSHWVPGAQDVEGWWLLGTAVACGSQPGLLTLGGTGRQEWVMGVEVGVGPPASSEVAKPRRKPNRKPGEAARPAPSLRLADLA